MKDASGLTLSGLAPSVEARAAIVAAARAATTGAVVDGMSVQGNIAAPPDVAAATSFALAQLARLTSGQAQLAGANLSFSGVASTPSARAAVDGALAGALPGGIRLAQASVLVRPYAMTAQADRSGIVFTGYAADQASRAELVAAAEAAGFSGRIRDELEIVAGAPPGFADAVRTGLGNLLRLDMGTVRVDERSIALQGMTCRDVIRQEVETGASSSLPQGYTGSGQVSIRQTGCTNCQAELDNATKGRSILFPQSRADITADADSKAVLDEVARVLQVCPTARIAVEGHTNLDGERRGFPNMPLSQARSQAVIDQLVARGLAADRFRPVGFGATKPLIPHGTDAARVQNRRVQFTIVNP
jgi:outer membrane protein OmpA-like peptidoglycan-associated protein